MTDPLRPPAKDALICAAFDVFSRNRGAALSDVADRAGVGRATLHRHFADRKDLLRTLALVALDEMDAAADKACEAAETYAEALRLSLGALIPLGDRYGFLANEPFDDDPAIAAAYERQMSEMRDMVEDAKREGAFDRDAPTAWIVQAFDHLLYAAWESVKAGDATHAQAADLAWRTLTTGLGRTTR
ncbi:MAG: helix-turn-helix domain-containing protein [Pseudomonadota bacterium]